MNKVKSCGLDYLVWKLMINNEIIWLKLFSLKAYDKKIKSYSSDYLFRNLIIKSKIV